MTFKVVLSLLHHRATKTDTTDQVVEPSLPKLLLLLSSSLFLARAEVVRYESDIVNSSVLEEMRRRGIRLDYGR